MPAFNPAAHVESLPGTQPQAPVQSDERIACSLTLFDARSRCIETWHGRSISTDEVFDLLDLLDLNGDGYRSRPEFAVLWSQSWIGDGPAKPGNPVCGRIPEQGHATAD
ncbi:hypothetical protein ACGFW5_09190 [Streptomyces sp. NPDC048416]|uniref:hypothetical protein n=1 Tax=Streptomyces sp. NPDC048416 TaxID=3365546 RepID=UPI00371669A5